MINARVVSAFELPYYISKFHVKGHGIENGLSEEEHLQRLSDDTTGCQGVIVFKDDEPIGGVAILPYMRADPHYVGSVLTCVYCAGDMGISGMRVLHRKLKELTILCGGNMYCLPRRKEKYAYLVKYYPVKE